MAVGHAGGSPRRRLGDLLDALFGEALELERRRRRRWMLLLLACCVAAGSILLARDPGGAGSRPVAAAGSGRVIVSSRPLPLRSDYTDLSVGGGRLLLVDYGNPGPRASGGGTCRVATVDPRNLSISSTARGACDNPALFGEHVLEVRQYSGRIVVRVATTSSRARAGYTLGPPLFSYNQCSDCWDESIYGPRSLWIYAPIATTRGYRAGGELFRVSERTGRLLQHWRMPSMTRSLLAVNDDGLWIAPSIDTGTPDGLYHVAPGMRHLQRVLTIGSDARFLVAAGHTVWFETWLATPGGIPRLWRLHGTRVTMRGERVRGGTPCTDLGEGPTTVFGNAAGIYCAQLGGLADGFSGPTTDTVLRISPGNRRETRVATVSPPADTVLSQAAADFRGSYYFLDPTTERGSAGRLYRVGPR